MKNKKSQTQITFTLNEVSQKSRKEGKILIVLFEGVYDLTNFVNHPGGQDILKQFTGKNGTQQFVEAGHLKGANIVSTMAKFRIGKFIQTSNPSL